VVAQLVEDHVVRRENQRLIPRLAGRLGQPSSKQLEVIGGQRVEAFERNALDEHRRAFVDPDRYRDLVLRVVQLGVDGDDPGLGVAAIGIERLDAADVAIELGPIEEALARPRQDTALARGDDRLQRPVADGGVAFEIDRRHLHVAGLAARRNGEGQRNEDESSQDQHRLTRRVETGSSSSACGRPAIFSRRGRPRGSA
jgi:hypothetical protein